MARQRPTFPMPDEPPGAILPSRHPGPETYRPCGTHGQKGSGRVAPTTRNVVARWHIRTLDRCVCAPGPERKWPCVPQGQNRTGPVRPRARIELAMCATGPKQQCPVSLTARIELATCAPRAKQQCPVSLRASTEVVCAPKAGQLKRRLVSGTAGDGDVRPTALPTARPRTVTGTAGIPARARQRPAPRTSGGGDAARPWCGPAPGKPP